MELAACHNDGNTHVATLMGTLMGFATLLGTHMG